MRNCLSYNEQFVPFPVFSTPLENFLAIVIKFKIVICKLIQFGSVLDLLFGIELNVVGDDRPDCVITVFSNIVCCDDFLTTCKNFICLYLMIWDMLNQSFNYLARALLN